MAQGLIYFLEPVKIKKKDSNIGFVAFCLHHHAGKTILQQHPVGQVGQRVMVNSVVEAFLVFTQLGFGA